jgi:dihydrofolate synthase/folylpolyglutamate synthase
LTPYDKAVASLYELQKSGMKFGLRNIRKLLHELGNPHKNFRSIHIAGSNGKGSTAAMIASVLSAAGYRTGLYTSPHLVSFRERIRINGRPISHSDVVRLTGLLRSMVNRYSVTFFEAVTALALRYFEEKKIDFAVIETGLGGRLDATNVVIPEISVITTISREHVEILGNLMGEIAYEKAGIIKRGIPCITGVRSRTALDVIRRVARSRKSPVILPKSVRVRVTKRSFKGTRADVAVGEMRYDGLFIDLPGHHQIDNAILALLTLHELEQRGIARISERSMRKGLAGIQKRTGLRSRLSLIRERPRMIVDVAHNPAAIATLVKEMKRLGISKVIVVFGVMKEKNVRPMIAALRPIISGAVIVQPSTERARALGVLNREFQSANVPVLFAGSVRQGIAFAVKRAGSVGTVLITGSHFVVGEALASLEGKKYLTINQ